MKKSGNSVFLFIYRFWKYFKKGLIPQKLFINMLSPENVQVVSFEVKIACKLLWFFRHKNIVKHSFKQISYLSDFDFLWNGSSIFEHTFFHTKLLEMWYGELEESLNDRLRIKTFLCLGNMPLYINSLHNCARWNDSILIEDILVLLHTLMSSLGLESKLVAFL